MILTRSNVASSSNQSISTAYKLRLCGMVAFAAQDSELRGLLSAMIRCVDAGAYGRLRTLYRGLPLNQRRELGLPPSCRADDVNERLEW